LKSPRGQVLICGRWLGQMARRKSTKSFALAANLSQAGLHTGLTLWYRLPILAALYGGRTKASELPELNRMVAEKATAMLKGAFAAQIELVRLSGAVMSGRLKAGDIPHIPAAIAGAGLRSAFRTVKANSRRLSRR
jgi:hypothetical protein